MMNKTVPIVRLDSLSSDKNSRSFTFAGYEKTVIATEPEEVLPALMEVERAVAARFHAVGFVSYEAGSAINRELPPGKRAELPLVWFAIFREREQSDFIITACNNSIFSRFEPLSKNSYIDAVNSIKSEIADGATYQVNYTVRQKFSYSGDPLELYYKLCCNQKSSYCAYINTGSHHILSASPELFFCLKNGVITMQPMKGTASRLPRADLDAEQIEKLKESQKERAENLMIVDMIRNDLARISVTGSVLVPKLFDVATYPTLHQMTSTVTASLQQDIVLTDIFRALFPCASITGAPKRSTMDIINTLEESPRGVYCGAIGYVSPDGEAVFSVAIRTAILKNSSNTGELGLGSGITWSSDAEIEYAECLTKGEFLSQNIENFSLIESIRFDDDGYFLLERHLKRLSASAAYFGFDYDQNVIESALADWSVRNPERSKKYSKIRLLLNSYGQCSVTSETLYSPLNIEPALVAISALQTDSSDPFLYHKTTNRDFYKNERAKYPDCYDVIFTNQRGELTEGSYNTLVLHIDDKLLTPAIDSGLLPGVLREELLYVGAIEEAVLTLNDLFKADKIWLINSVRGWRESLIDKTRSGSYNV